MSGRPKRFLGQNFLVDREAQRRIVEALEAGPEDEVLEIGPGRGALTEHLVGTAGRLLLVEKDRDLAEALRIRFADRPEVRVLEGDILEVDRAKESRDPHRLKVIGNIPYNITTPILFSLLAPPLPARIVLMVQEEVADRIVAAPGEGSYGALSVGARLLMTVRPVLRVPAGAFRPRPRVNSAVILLERRIPAPLGEEELPGVRTLVRAAFQWRRKQLRKILRDHPDLVAAGWAGPVPEPFDPLLRPEMLSPESFVELYRALRRPAG